MAAHHRSTWHGCLSTGWCQTSSSCTSYVGLASGSSPPNQPWIYCGSGSPKAPPPSSVPPPPLLLLLPQPLPPPLQTLRPLPPSPPRGCGCLGTWAFNGRTWNGCLSTGWCVILLGCPYAAGTINISSDGLSNPAPWLVLRPKSQCACLLMWDSLHPIQSFIALLNYNGLNGTQCRARCNPANNSPFPQFPPAPAPPTLPPPFPPGSQPCGFYRRTEDGNLTVRTGGIQIWTCGANAVSAAAVRIARRYAS